MTGCHSISRFCAVAALVAALAPPAVAQSTRTAPQPTPAIDAIVDALTTHDIVTIADAHGRTLQQQFLLSLLRDPALPGVVNDIVLEGASARYQGALDRFVRGDDIDESAVRPAWEDTTQPQALGEQAAELVRAIRAVNRGLPEDRRLRVVAGDPPIDWTHITNPRDHFDWILLRDTYPADIIRRQVLERGRKALVIYGQMHSQRAQAFTNYDMTSWQSQTLVSILAASGARIFSIWSFFDDRPLPSATAAWATPSLAALRGSEIGAEDFARYVLIPNRFGLVNGAQRRLPPEEWKALPFEEQFDAVLYLGKAGADSLAAVPQRFCRDAQAMARRFERIALVGLPPAEIDQLKDGCRAR